MALHFAGRVALRCVPLAATVLLAGCNPFKADTPTAQELSFAFGFPISESNCVAATGKPGVVCDLSDGGSMQVSRRLVKRNDGTWDPVPD